MRLIKIICTTTLLLFAFGAAPVQAEVLVNEWQEFAFPVTDDSGCAGEDGFVSGVVHNMITAPRKGDLGFFINSKGIWKGNESGVEATWKDNITDIIPNGKLDDIGNPDNHLVWTVSQNLRIIGQGGLLFRLKAKVHLTEVGGEFIVYFDEVTTVCNI